MTVFSILSVSFGLAMDAFAVSLCGGASVKSKDFGKLVFLCFSFGFFQGLMPLAGLLSTNYFAGYVNSFGHWVAFILLAIVGGKMVYEGFKTRDVNAEFPLNFSGIIMLSIATSIDAFAAGIGLGCVGTDVFLTVILIGFVTFALSAFGIVLGKRAGEVLEKKAVLLGGVILFLIGVKIFFEGGSR